VVEHKIFTVLNASTKKRNRKSNETLGLLRSGQAKIIWERLQICSSSCRGHKGKSLRTNLKARCEGRRLRPRRSLVN